MPKIIPCPFCGETPAPGEVGTDESGKWGFVECGCGARGPDVRTGYQPSPLWEVAAVEAWNTRAEIPAAGGSGTNPDPTTTKRDPDFERRRAAWVEAVRMDCERLLTRAIPRRWPVTEQWHDEDQG
jgi:Lar family restriction alleviation protein